MIDAMKNECIIFVCIRVGLLKCSIIHLKNYNDNIKEIKRREKMIKVEFCSLHEIIQLRIVESYWFQFTSLLLIDFCFYYEKGFKIIKT